MPTNSQEQLCVSLGWTPLHIATENQDVTKVKKLIKSSNVNAQDKFKRTPLTIAASKGNIQLASIFVENGADVDAGFPLHYASEKGHTEVVRYLLQKGADVNLVKDQNYPLIIAANWGHLEVVKILVDGGAELACINDTKETALHRACHSGNSKVIEFLVDAGCDIDVPDRYDRTPLQVCLSYHEDEPELVKLLLSKGASVHKYDPQELTYLHDSCNPEATLELIKCGVSTNSVDIRNETPLYAACEVEHTECGKVLLQHGADPNIVAKGGWSPLHFAAKHGDLELARELVSKGARVNAASAQNVVPLHLAVKEGHVDVVRFLLEQGSLEVPVIDVEDVNSYSGKFISGDGETPLSLARRYNRKEIEDVLKSWKGPCNKSSDMTSNHDASFPKDLMGWSPLHHSIYEGLDEMSSELIKKGASVNALDDFERTPLSIAAFKNDVRLIRLLVENSADVNLGLPLHHAVSNKATEAVLELVKYCDVNIKNRGFMESPPLLEAASESLSTIVKILLENRADVNGVNKNGETALHRACQFGDLDSVRLLVDHGGDVNSVDECKDTPLICAASNSTHSIVKILVDKGADVHRLDSSRWTPLHRAFRDELITSELIAAGADVNHSNDNVESPLFLATAFPKVVKVLLDHKADPTFVAFGGWTPLHESVSEGKLESVRLFLDHGIDVNVGSAENILPLYLAAIKGHREILQELLDRGSYVDPVILDVGVIRFEEYYFSLRERYHIVPGNTPLLGAAAKGHLEVVELLYSRGADLTAKNSGGNTVLHEAVGGGFKNVVEFLISVGVDVEAKNKEEKTALELARESQNDELILVLSFKE